MWRLICGSALFCRRYRYYGTHGICYILAASVRHYPSMYIVGQYVLTLAALCCGSARLY